ncbi:magnesium transporter [Roseiconus lacunae]|uniref:magnesium transporter n=1 Tax=Roseiconus lacunae TaxID=2605694 RepID=UPI0011F3EE5D|nr:magnesium transporter [Roseiconus lacunae]
MNDVVTDPITENDRPWEEVVRVANEGSVEELSELLDSMSVAEQAYVFSHMEDDAEAVVLRRLPAEDAADLIGHFNESEAARMIQLLESQAAATILQEMPIDEQADVIGDLPEKEAEAILQELPQQNADNVRELTAYPDNVAGGMMVVEMLRFRSEMTVAEVIDEINRGAEHYTDLDVRYAYVCDDEGRLVGVLPMQNLLFVKRYRKLGEIMIKDPLSVRTTAPLEELAEFFESHVYLGVPVVDDDGVLKGVLHREAVQYEEVRAAENDYLKSQGIVGGEELRTMPVWLRSRRRLSWLSINIFLNLGAAAVIAYFQETLESVIALAVFLPIISDMSGCSGNQAVAVSMRELSLGIIRPTEFFRVWWKEFTVGLINGSVLGGLIAVVAVLFDGNPYLGVVVGVALCLNTLIAVSIGGVVPLLLKRFGFDPAVASGPLLTTVTDMCGFFLVLGLATVMLSRLT